MSRRMLFLSVLLLCCNRMALPQDKTSYPVPGLLIEPAELAKPEVANRFAILDARPRADFEAGRVPGARWVDHAAWAKAFGDGKDAAGWGKRIGELGIRADAKVVVYDDNHSREAGRIWWILRYWNLEDVRLLNGGWRGWKAARLPVETAAARTAAPAEITVKPRSERLATKDLVLKSLKDGSLQIIDARSEGEFCGTETFGNNRAGAIPGARNLDWIELLDKETHRFKNAGEMEKLFEAAGIDLKKPAAAHCQSGGRASVMAFALELMGAKDVRNYYASWAEWSSAADTPVVPGKPKPKK